MDISNDQVRATLDRLIKQRGVSYSGVSELLGKNAAYIQQFIKRGSPRKLDESDRRLLARFFGVAETELGAPADIVGGKAGRGRQGGGWPNARLGQQRSYSGKIEPRNIRHDVRRDMRIVPLMPIGASAGAGALTGDEMPTGQIAFDTHWLQQLGADCDALNMIKVEGDSMSPSLNDGDDILVSLLENAASPRRDGIYVLRMDDMLMVKRVSFRPDGYLSITSDNTLYASFPDTAPDQVVILGRVIWAGRRM